MTDDTEKLIRSALAAERQDSFTDGFADRAIARWKSSQNDVSFGDVLARQFKRFAPVAVAAALLLGFYNVKSASAGPTVDRLLGLTTITIDAAYDLGDFR
jgi:hypothetical protein